MPGKTTPVFANELQAPKTYTSVGVHVDHCLLFSWRVVRPAGSGGDSGEKSTVTTRAYLSTGNGFSNYNIAHALSETFVTCCDAF